MVANPRNLDSIFDAVVAIEDLDERVRYLDEHCHDPHMRGEIERLLNAHDNPQSFLSQPPPSFPATVQHAATPSNRLSVLQAIGNAFGVKASVSLHDAAEASEDPVQQLSSAEIPRSEPDSRYQLFGEIARGGMGAILKGRDTDLGRDLAVKVLLENHKAKPEVIQRFVEEAQIGGQLQHPGIAPVYELGQFADQRPYFTMKLVKGKTLAALLSARKNVDTDRAKFIGIFEQICQTMAYAHSRGVIHRDLKPANIMVGAFGEVQVMDWGLAKVLSAGGVADEKKPSESRPDHSIIETLRSSGSETPIGIGSQTQMGSVMGTPAYMPPEQALGEIDQLDQRCDVFGLGAILCEILTGDPPYVAEDTVKVFRLASRGKLDECFERLEVCTADDDLIALAKACLSAEREDRPHDAGVLADRLSEHQAAVETRLRESEIDRAAQTVRADEESKRRRVSVALAVSVLALVVSLSGGGLWLQAKETAAAKKETVQQQELAAAANQLADEEKEKARIEREAKEELRWSLYTADIQRAQLEIDRGSHATARRVLATHVPRAGQNDLRGFEWHYLSRRCPAPTIRRIEWSVDVPTVQVDKEYATRFYNAVSGDGKRIAAVVASEPSVERRLVVWNADTGRETWSTKLDNITGTFKINLNDDGRYIGLSVSREKPGDPSGTAEIYVWNVETKTHLATITDEQIPGLTSNFQFRPKSQSVAVRLVDEQHAEWGNPQTICIWDFAKKSGFTREISPGSISFSSDGQSIAVSMPAQNRSERATNLSNDQAVVRIWDLASGKLRQELRTPVEKSHWASRFSPDGRYIAMAARDNTIYVSREFQKQDKLLIWDVKTGALRVAADSVYGNGSDVRFSPSGEYVAFVSRRRNAVEVLRVSDGSPLVAAEASRGCLFRFTDDEQSIEAIGRDGRIMTWKLPTNPFEKRYAIRGHASLSGDGTRLLRIPSIVTDSGKQPEDGSARLFDVNGRLIATRKLPWLTDWRSWHLDSDGSHAIGAQGAANSPSKGRFYLWSLFDGQVRPIPTSLFENEQLLHWEVSPASSVLARLVECNDDGGTTKHQLRLHNYETSSETSVDLEGEVLSVRRFWPDFIAFSSDGKTVGVYTRNIDTEGLLNDKWDRRAAGTLAFYDVETSQLTSKISVPGTLEGLVFSRDGQRLAANNFSGGRRGLSRIEIWNVATGELETSIESMRGQLTFTDDGRRLISMVYMSTNRANRRSDVLTIWDVATGSELLSRPYYGGGGQKVACLPEQDRLFGYGYFGLPQIWDGRAVESTRN